MAMPLLAAEADDALLQCKVGGSADADTANHGNIEQMTVIETGQPHAAHTTNPVSLVYVGDDKTLDADGSLSGLAPTVLAMLGGELPLEMTSRSLI